MSDPFSPDALHAALAQAMQGSIVPDGKQTALVVGLDGTGARAVIASRIGEHWEVSGGIDWHAGGDFSAGARIVASW